MNAMSQITVYTHDPYRKPYRYYTLAERVDNAKTENDMRAALCKRKKTALKLPEMPAQSVRQIDAQSLIFDLLSGPMTVNQIAEARGKDPSGVQRMLAAMESRGQVKSTTPPKVNGRQPAKLWTRATDEYMAHDAMAEKTRASRARVLAALDGKMSAAEVAEIAGHTSQYVREILQGLAAAGKVVCEVPDEWAAAGGPAPHLWSRVEQTPDEWVNAKVQGYDNRAKIYAVLDTPKAPFEVADAIAANRQTVAHIMRQMAERGLITEAGQTRTDSGKPVKMWVRT